MRTRSTRSILPLTWDDMLTVTNAAFVRVVAVEGIALSASPLRTLVPAAINPL